MTGRLMARLGLWVRITCALALLAIGLDHKPVVLDTHGIALAELSQYLLPDGTLAALCQPSEDGKAKAPSHDAGNPCEACRLSASILLAMPADTVGRPMPRLLAQLAPPRAQVFHRPLFPPNTAPRGPPSLSIA